MSKPDDIPQSVWAAAERGLEYAAKRQELIARAVMAETEACANLVENADSWTSRFDLANVIRRRSDPK